jgi:hypothetical protein
LNSFGSAVMGQFEVSLRRDFLIICVVYIRGIFPERHGLRRW